MKLLLSVLLFSLLIYWNLGQIRGLSHRSYHYLKLENRNYIQNIFTQCERQKFLLYLPYLKSVKFQSGGYNASSGLDCSGLIVFLYNRIGCNLFRSNHTLVNDISSESLYRFNCIPISDLNKLSVGDFIFFDADNNNIIEHVSIFNNLDDENNVWVWDASDYPDGEIINQVSYRKINNFWKKNPKFGKPLKTLEIGSYWDLLIFP